jgi:hypothetical protein
LPVKCGRCECWGCCAKACGRYPGPGECTRKSQCVEIVMLYRPSRCMTCSRRLARREGYSSGDHQSHERDRILSVPVKVGTHREPRRRHPVALAPASRQNPFLGIACGALSEPCAQYCRSIQPHWPGCLGCGSCWVSCAKASVGSSTVAMIRVLKMMIVAAM